MGGRYLGGDQLCLTNTGKGHGSVKRLLLGLAAVAELRGCEARCIRTVLIAVTSRRQVVDVVRDGIQSAP